MIIMENHLKTSCSTRKQQDKQQQQPEEDEIEEEEEDAEKLEEEDDDDDEDDDEEEEEEEAKKLEEEVREIAKEVEKRRSTLPDHLESSISSYLSSQRPSLSLLDNDDNGSLPGPSSGPHSGARSDLGNSSSELEADDGVQNPDEVQLLRDKISSNISAIPKGLKRMNDCISKIDKLVSSNVRIPPAFKRKKS